MFRIEKLIAANWRYQCSTASEKEAVDYVVKYNRQCKEKHKPSSIIKMQANGQFTIIRE